MGKLYIVATPIGNLEDMTLRGIKTLGQADIILAEDTRSTGKLLKHHKISSQKLLSFFEGNEEKRIAEVISLLREDKTIALVSESGTPLISDPGFKLVRELTKLGIDLEVIPGPTALIAALTVSGLPTNAFCFLGYLPKKRTRANKILGNVKKSLEEAEVIKTVILYESPHRLIKALQSIKEVFGDINIVVARELTKMHEEVRREKVSEAIVHFNSVKPRGEFVLLFSLLSV